MEIKDLRCFCVTAEMEHVTKAAASLNIAQPYLSRIIHSIEDEIGAKLFEQTGRNIRLTPSGEVFYKHAKRVLASMDTLYSEMDYLYNCHENTLTLLVNSDSLLERLIREFNKLRPSYTLSVQYATPDEMVESLVSGQAQFVLSSSPLRIHNDIKNIETKPVLGLKGCLIVPPGHRLEGKGSVCVDEIRDELIITMPKTNSMRQRLQLFFDEHTYQPRIILETNNLNIIVDTVRRGFGIAFVTELIAMDFDFPRKNIISISNTSDDMGHFSLHYNRLSCEHRNVRHFMEFALSFFENLKQELDRDSPFGKIDRS